MNGIQQTHLWQRNEGFLKTKKEILKKNKYQHGVIRKAKIPTASIIQGIKRRG